jgi:hypothetical protein
MDGRIQIEIMAWMPRFPFAKTASSLCGEVAVGEDWDPSFSLKNNMGILVGEERSTHGASLVGAFAILSY